MAGNPYETDELLAQYLLFHYGTAAEQMPYEAGPLSALYYPVRCVQEALRAGGTSTPARGLDLGCAVGRTSFEMARYCGEVVGIDFSEKFIEAARTMQKDGQISYLRKDEGELGSKLEARIPGEIDRTKVRFMTGDACVLPEKLGTFDLVLLSNLIDRLVRPAECLKQMKDVVSPGGMLAVMSPYSWTKEFTPRQNWLGGRMEVGEPIRTLDGLKWILGGHFQLMGTKDIPFLIREHSRKFQWSVTEGSFWKRK